MAINYGLLADAVVALHFAFVLFVGLGGLFVLRWPKLAIVHVPAFLWGAATAIFGWICPLTYLENDLREIRGQPGYSDSFIETYILPLLYPDLLFAGGVPRGWFIVLGVFVLLINAIVYWRVIKKYRTKATCS